MDAIEHPTSLIDVDSVCPHHEHHHHHHDHDHEEHDHDHDEHDHDHDEHDHDEHDHDHCDHDHDHCDHDHDHDEHDHDEHEHHHHHGHCCCGHDHDHEDHDADEVFENIGIETVRRIDRAQLEKALKEIENEEKYGTVLRMKGILQSTDGSWIHFDYTPGESEIRSGSADYTGRLCVIGCDLKEDEIKALLGM